MQTDKNFSDNGKEIILLKERIQNLESELAKAEFFRNFYSKAWKNNVWAILIIGADGKILDANEHCSNFFECPKNQLVGFTLEPYLTVREQKLFIRDLKEVLNYEQAMHSRQYQIQFPGNKVKTAFFTLEKFVFKNHEPAILIIIQDLSEMLKFKKNLEQKEYFLSEAQQIAKLGYYAMNLSTGIWESSEILDKIFGINKTFPHDVGGWLQIVHPEESQQMKAYLEDEVIGKKRKFEREYRIRRVIDGEVRWVHGNGILHFNANGLPVLMIGTIQDITDRKLNEFELQKTQQLYSNLLDSMNELVFQCDLRGRFVYLNSSCELMLGYTANELTGHKLTEIQLPGEAKFMNQVLTHIKKGQPLRNLFFNLLSKDKQIVEIELNINPISDSKNNVTGFSGIAYDVTSKRKNEALLQQKTVELDKFFHTAIDLLCVADTEGRFRRINPEWEKVLGYTQHELLGGRFLDYVHPDDMESTLKAISNLMEQKSVYNFVNRYRCKDGSYKFIEWRSTPEGDLIYAAARDISERIKTEAELKLINQELKETNAQKDKFLSIIAHDLRSPLSSIMGLSEMLVEQHTAMKPADLLWFLQQLNDTSNRLNQLMENLLDWSKLQSGKFVMRPEQLDIAIITEEVIELMYSLASNKRVSFKLNMCAPVFVKADAYMVKTVFRNLISNAVKFSKPGNEVTISCRELSEFIEIKISDTGIGIHPDRLPLIFLPEENITTPGTSGERGSGLGLALCKEFIVKNGGQIWAESILSKGSSFFFTLPKYQ